METAYAVLGLYNLRKVDLLDEGDEQMLRRGYTWLLTHYRPFRMKDYKCWLNKEIYRPQRIDRAYELAALLAVTLEDEQS